MNERHFITITHWWCCRRQRWLPGLSVRMFRPGRGLKSSMRPAQGVSGLGCGFKGLPRCCCTFKKWDPRCRRPRSPSAHREGKATRTCSSFKCSPSPLLGDARCLSAAHRRCRVWFRFWLVFFFFFLLPGFTAQRPPQFNKLNALVSKFS